MHQERPARSTTFTALMLLGGLLLVSTAAVAVGGALEAWHARSTLDAAATLEGPGSWSVKLEQPGDYLVLLSDDGAGAPAHIDHAVSVIEAASGTPLALTVNPSRAAEEGLSVGLFRLRQPGTVLVEIDDHAQPGARVEVIAAAQANLSQVGVVQKLTGILAGTMLLAAMACFGGALLVTRRERLRRRRQTGGASASASQPARGLQPLPLDRHGAPMRPEELVFAVESTDPGTGARPAA